MRSLRMKFLPWIADVLRSPLPSDTKTWILRCCPSTISSLKSLGDEANAKVWWRWRPIRSSVM